MKLILVRHTTPDVPKGMCYGWSDVDVAPTFVAEANMTLGELKKHQPIDKAFTSPLKRAKKLSEFCGFADAQEDARLKEMNMGEWEMQFYDKIKDPALQEWYRDYMHLPASGGESFPILYARVAEFLDELKDKPFKRVAIFAHGGPIVCAGIYAGLFKEEDAFRHLVPYGGIQIIEI